MKRVLLEGLIVAVAGALLAFLANAVSPKGLHDLTRDYFYLASNRPPVVAVPTNSAARGTNQLTPAEVLAARLRSEGLQLADSNKVSQLFNDPRYRMNLVVFVDARSANDDDYTRGHIPGAYQFDRSHPDKYIPVVLPACSAADQIVVYCNGGDCDDSDYVAVFLRDGNIPKEKIYVYGGGWTEWTNNRMVIETGAQNSGQLTNTNR